MKRVWLIIISVILLAGVCWAADKPVSQLPATENIKNEDLFLVSQYNAGNYFSRHITFANLKKKLDELYQAIGGGGGEGIAVSDIYTGTINDGDLTKYDQSTGKLKSAGAAAGYTEPQSNLPICRTGAGTVGACTNLTDKTIPTYTEPASNLPLCRTGSGTWGACSNLTDAAIDDVGVKIVMVTGDPDEVIECEGRDRTYVIGANANYFFQLPADPSGIKYCFANGAYETVISIVPDGTDVIRFIGDTTGEGDGLVSTGAYQDYVCLLGLNTSTWRVIQTMGTWAIDVVELPSEEEEPPNGNGCVTPTGTLFTESFGEGDQSCWSAGPSTCNNTWTVVSGTYAIDSSPAGAPENTACDNSMLMSRTDASQNIRADLGAGALTDVDTTINFTMYIDSTTITEWGDLSFFGVTTGSSFFDGLQYVVLLERQAPGGGAATRIGVMNVAESGILYQCKAGNTWEKIFEPYTCPHQLADPEGDYHCDFSVAGVAGYGMEGAPDEPEEPEEPEPEPTGVILPWIITGG